MPQFGAGIVPQAGSIANELSFVTRRAFLERVIIQIYVASPLICALIQSAQMASGGLSPITAPLQGNPMVTGQWVGYDGSFNQPGVTPGLQNAEFNLAAFTTAIPFLGFEGLVQMDRSEEHTSELQSPDHLVCRLLLEKKKKETIDKRSI